MGTLSKQRYWEEAVGRLHHPQLRGHRELVWLVQLVWL